MNTTIRTTTHGTEIARGTTTVLLDKQQPVAARIAGKAYYLSTTAAPAWLAGAPAEARPASFFALLPSLTAPGKAERKQCRADLLTALRTPRRQTRRSPAIAAALARQERKAVPVIPACMTARQGRTAKEILAGWGVDKKDMKKQAVLVLSKPYRDHKVWVEAGLLRDVLYAVPGARHTIIMPDVEQAVMMRTSYGGDSRAYTQAPGKYVKIVTWLPACTKPTISHLIDGGASIGYKPSAFVHGQVDA